MTRKVVLADFHGNMERFVEFEPWRVPPEVGVSGDDLVWSLRDPTDPKNFILRKPGPKFLEGFLNLRNGTPNDVATYASRWGVLMICEAHQLPNTHNPMPYPSPPYSSLAWSPCAPRGWPLMPCYEPTARWKHFARSMDAMLRIAADLRRDVAGNPEQWDVLYEDLEPEQRIFGSLRPGSGRLKDDEMLDLQKAQLAEVVNEFLYFSGVRPRFRWGFNREAAISMLAGTMLGALAVKLALAIQDTGGLAVCSEAECGKLYAPTMRPRPNVDNYCPRCRALGIPLRNAKRRERERARSTVKAPKRKRRRVST